jgi:methionine-S-sulfoxide reductase
MQSIILGGGCFWCTEAVFRRLRGVNKVTPGYAGGTVEEPDYESVSTGASGHAEVIRVEYDEKVIKLRKILEVFFTTHDPTTLNRQGYDIGKEYRSIILCADKKQEREVKEFIKEIQPEIDRPIVTEVRVENRFFSSEEYHQDYYEKNKGNSYCTLVIDPKIKKLKEKFSKELKRE